MSSATPRQGLFTLLAADRQPADVSEAPATAPNADDPAQFGAYLPLAATPGTAAEAPNCRYGAVAGGTTQYNWLSALRMGWYLDFNAHQPVHTGAAEFVQTVRITQTKEGCTYTDGYNVNPPLTDVGLGAIVRANLGALWIIGNEPERGPNPNDCVNRIQDDTFPQVYARGFHDVQQFIRQRDATARIAPAGLVQVTPNRLQYLDIVWQTYQSLYGEALPVDVWTMHIYILPEARANGAANDIASIALGTDPALAIRESGNDPARCADGNVYCWGEHDSISAFREQVLAMRTWMKAHGQQQKPLLLSEWSLLYPFEDYDDPINPTTCYLQDEFGHCFTAPRVARYLSETLSYLETAADANLGYPRDSNRLVQRWLWWGMYVPSPDVGYISNLLASGQLTLTLVGQTLRDAIQAQPATVNLFPQRVTHSLASQPDGTATAVLTVSLRNSGNAPPPAPFGVTVYADEGLSQAVASTVVTASLGGCEQRTLDATLRWPGILPGWQRYWVRVDSGAAIAETDETDNIAAGALGFAPASLRLPMIWR